MGLGKGSKFYKINRTRTCLGRWWGVGYNNYLSILTVEHPKSGLQGNVLTSPH